MIRLGFVGCGYWGMKLLRVFSNLPEVKVLFVCDKHSQKKQWVSTSYPQSIFTTDYSRLLESECDAIVIATPAKSHYQLSEACLQARKHVFVEKPLALNRSKAMKLVSLADSHNLCLLVGHTFEFDPAIAAIEKIVQSGELGQIYYVDSLRNNWGMLRLDVNVIWDLVIHDISILHKVLGNLPQRVSAVGRCHITQENQNLCERCQVNMIFPTDIRASVQASWLEPLKTRQIRIIGSQKSLVFEPTKKHEINIYNQNIKIHSDEAGVEVQYRQNGHSVMQYSNFEPLQLQAKNFVESILNGKPTNALIAVNIVGVLDAMQTSLNREGKWIDVGLMSV